MNSETKQPIDIKKLLKSVLHFNSSDLHLVPGSEPQIRIDKSLKPLNLPVLTAKEVEEMAYALIVDKQKKIFEDKNELDFSFELEDIGRFRANYYRTIAGIACAFRMIPIEIPPLAKFNNNPIFKELVKKEKGLILVTGPTGSGKSTTLASMLHEINLTKSKHIITIEDPVEFIHTNIKSLFSQREVGANTESFATALKFALRQDPDVILIGEMRDKETIEAALTAAETGHIVFATLHTNSAPSTINRIIDVFDAGEQSQVRAQLASSLISVVSQSLMPKIGGGVVATQEVLITNPAIQNLIREDKIHQIYSQMQLNQNETSMTTQNDQLLTLLRKNIITKETAIASSNRPEEFLRVLSNL
ncbi:MAG: type IV pili twitching motility protein PilT [Sulfurimonas sp. RIFOXYD12_FULL_33_39]|uniref:type IV pilus twitching motility protein PilT n=1 Tax=unclassified Sulfurimonas TaxID=2623549 RepID=UPI0008D551F9|nr:MULTISPECIES: type IV pilus twitching motility protein PilT [unclassified Sulfurimonas]OHE02736.1 MAG: type IV pili twitching motility protein PilT [Sulfurimonas sp. RIFCSPLOWO2_12_FULL_34_6]OHE09255.1 MAG: type IV pili twitching motility protein PilT [Sulfurimonas sp. RIFOXYD12_FULL_33_39]OHE12962.1 MAG: type IV pili twitching motility protein PilT [Sulfurimonas sp. RIFOXYD2_FULL_34_21]DAB27837.1 MAG TPA: type IV pili twitching motility protein PilT [Sulfurimonas sp. UBA10385]